jgi:hypothetical protein
MYFGGGNDSEQKPFDTSSFVIEDDITITTSPLQPITSIPLTDCKAHTSSASISRNLRQSLHVATASPALENSPRHDGQDGL